MSKNIWGLEKRFDFVDLFLLGVCVCGGLGVTLGVSIVQAAHECPPSVVSQPADCPDVQECKEASRFQLENAMAICEDFKHRWEACTHAR